MILAIDIGNTNITLGGYSEGEIKFISRLATDSRRTADQYAVELYDLMRLAGFSATDTEGSVIASVVPSVGTAIANAVKKLTDVEPIVLGPGVKTGVNIKIDNPAQLGADLAAGAAGAIDKYPMPCIIIDMGTATTLSVLDKNSALIGGVIAAGIGLTMNALTQNTALLSAIPIEAPKNTIGKNTVECMQSGLVLGTAAMIDGMVSRIENELGETCTVVATGGRASQIIPHCNTKMQLDDNLLLDGLIKIYYKNI
ncbi:MAG: type III pantothenate kinase [Ruminococcaceae bacterium]|nr:type III pantothenate kinase [Oscillospiraceae bacterium]